MECCIRNPIPNSLGSCQAGCATDWQRQNRHPDRLLKHATNPKTADRQHRPNTPIQDRTAQAEKRSDDGLPWPGSLVGKELRRISEDLVSSDAFVRGQTGTAVGSDLRLQEIQRPALSVQLACDEQGRSREGGAGSLTTAPEVSVGVGSGKCEK